MTRAIPLIVAALIAQTTFAAATDGASPDVSPVEAWQADRLLSFSASEVSLEDFKWIARPIVVFADTPADPRFIEQISLIAARTSALAERDVVVITDTDPSEQSDIRRKLRPRGFMLAIIGKDGGVKLRKPFPWDVREISRSIDKMPMRQQEIRDRRVGG